MNNIHKMLIILVSVSTTQLYTSENNKWNPNKNNAYKYWSHLARPKSKKNNSASLYRTTARRQKQNKAGKKKPNKNSKLPRTQCPYCSRFFANHTAHYRAKHPDKLLRSEQDTRYTHQEVQQVGAQALLAGKKHQEESKK